MGHVYLGWLLSCGQQVLVLPRCGGGGWGPPVGPLLRAGGAALFPLPASFLPLGLLVLEARNGENGAGGLWAKSLCLQG